MGVGSIVKRELWQILEWKDETRDTLCYRFPDEDRSIKRGAQLIVRESQVAQFVYLGEFGDTFGPGKHRMVTDNLPLLTTIKSWQYAGESPFKADVYFINTRLFTGNKWGTRNPIMMRDDDLGIVRARAFGIYDFRIMDPKVFLKEVGLRYSFLEAHGLTEAHPRPSFGVHAPIVSPAGIVFFGSPQTNAFIYFQF